MSTLLFVRQIWQKNNDTFSIEWNDGLVQDFRLCNLQRNCPCAHCTDEMTGKQLLDPKTISDDVKAVVIRSIGRYGLRIQFTSGCSTGIYSFDRLRKMKG
jgi:ATP-binding protein involved in chromosome partitioning